MNKSVRTQTLSTRHSGAASNTQMNPAGHALVKWVCLGVGLLAALAYLPSLRHEFIGYDDNQYIYENYLVSKGLTWDGLVMAFTSFKASNWHPITWITHMLDVQMWGQWAGGHHLTNLLLHAINTSLLMLVLWRMTGAIWRCAFVVVVFAIHPLHVESVAWIAERKDVLSVLFGLLAMLSYISYVKQKRTGAYVVLLIWFALSLMSKPMLVTLPAVLLLLDIWPLKRWNATSWPRLLIEKLPLLAMAIASSVVTVLAQKAGAAMSSLEYSPLVRRIGNALVAYATYIIKTVWPTDLAVFYQYPLESWPGWKVGGAAVLLLAITAVCLWRMRRQPPLLIGWLWFLGTLVPVIGLVQVGSQSHADRYMYFPMIGLLIMLAWSIPKTLGQGSKRIITGAVIAGCLVLAVMMQMQLALWRDTYTLFSHTTRVTDNNFVALNIMGVALRDKGDLEGAHRHLNEALAILPDYRPAHNNLGLVALDRGQNEQAIMYFEKARSLDETDPNPWNNLGTAYANLGRHADAVRYYERAVQLKPDLWEGWINLGNSYNAIKDFERSYAALMKVAQMRPDMAEVHAGIGSTLWNAGQHAQAIPYYRRALELQPELIETRVSLGVALAATEQIDQAIQQFEIALRQNPNHEAAKHYLQMARAQKQGSTP